MAVTHDHESEHGHAADDHDHEHSPDHDRSDSPLGKLKHLVTPHSHDAALAVDTGLEASARGIRTLLISFAVLAVTAGGQAAVAAVSGSIALLGDTLHNVA